MLLELKYLTQKIFIDYFKPSFRSSPDYNNIIYDEADNSSFQPKLEY